MADPLPNSRLWTTPERATFAAAARACYLTGESYSGLKDILATVDEMTPLETRYVDPDDTFEKVFGQREESH
jgi:hypothetical protein